MSTPSSLFIAAHAIEIIQNNSPWQLIRLFISAVLAVPMFFSDRAQVRLVALLLSFIGLFAFFFRYSVSVREHPADQSDVPSIPATRALSKFLIPTTSVWPKTYVDIAVLAEQFSKGKCLHIHLETIFRDFRCGLIELRNPTSDLPQLMKGQLQLDGWNFKLDVSFKDKAKIWAWIVSEELSLLPEEGFPRPSNIMDEENIPSVERMVLKHYCSLFFETTDNIIIWPSLDAIPRAFVQQFIRATQEKIKTKHTKQKTSVLTFTTREAGLSAFNDAFVYAALPFSRTFSKSNKDSRRSSSDNSCSRTTTSLFTHLPDVLALLTSGPHALRVLSLSNASASYANALDAHADALEYNDTVRRGCVQDVGIHGWREERLIARWEAALLRAGLLTRWIVLSESQR